MYLKTTCFDFKQLQKLDVITDTTVQQEVTYLEHLEHQTNQA